MNDTTRASHDLDERVDAKLAASLDEQELKDVALDRALRAGFSSGGGRGG